MFHVVLLDRVRAAAQRAFRCAEAARDDDASMEEKGEKNATDATRRATPMTSPAIAQALLPLRAIARSAEVTRARKGAVMATPTASSGAA